MSGRVALDTNVVIRLFKNDPAVMKILSTSSVICLPVPVAAELLYGAENSGRPADNIKICHDLIDLCEVLNITRKTAGAYSRVRSSLKASGRPIPENDVWIAAVCMEHNVPLVTSDRHFDFVEGLNIIGV